jgi:hypothetical protein
MSVNEEAVTLVVGLGEVGKPLYTILKSMNRARLASTLSLRRLKNL